MNKAREATRRTLIDREGNEHTFPPPMRHAYDIVDGRVQTRSLEAHVVDHCNLTCANCCSLSPILPKRFTSVERFEADIRHCLRVVEPELLKIVGGEPLLHPDIDGILHAAKKLRGTAPVSLTTNGLLLPKMSERFWELVDAITISLYPKPPLREECVALIEAQARRYGVRLNWKTQDEFVVMDRDVEHEGDYKPDGELSHDDARADLAHDAGPAEDVGEIFRTCWLRERCHLVRDGVFYQCTRPVHMATLHGRSPQVDGITLDGASAEDVATYLTRGKPLKACERCLGGSGRFVKHRMLSRAQVDEERKLRLAQSSG